MKQKAGTRRCRVPAAMMVPSPSPSYPWQVARQQSLLPFRGVGQYIKRQVLWQKLIEHKRTPIDHMTPLILQERDGREFSIGDRGLISERHVGPQEVVVSDEKCGEGNGPIPGAKAIGDTDVVFVGAIEPFDQLFVTSIFFGFAVEVL